MSDTKINRTDWRFKTLKVIEAGELTFLNYIFTLGPIGTRTVDFLVNNGCALSPGASGMPFELTQKGRDLLREWGGESGVQ